MANTNAPYGFKFHRCLGGGTGPEVRHYTVTASANIYRGNPVGMHGTTGNLVAFTDVPGDWDGDVGRMIGIAAATTTSSSLTHDFPVILAQNAEFQVQIDSGATVTTLALFQDVFMDVTAASKFGIVDSEKTHSTNGLGESICALTGASPADIIEFLIVTDYVRRADNEFGDYMDVIVRWNPLMFQAGPWTTAVPA